MSNNVSDWRSRECGAFWKRVSQRTGEPFFSGNIVIDKKMYQLVMYSNKFKSENIKAPDLRVYLSEVQEKNSEEPVIFQRTKENKQTEQNQASSSSKEELGVEQEVLL